MYCMAPATLPSATLVLAASSPLDELDTPKPKRRPVIIDRHLADSGKANLPQR